MTLKIGVLIPRSDMYPVLGNDLLQGLRLYFKNEDTIEPQFIIESIGNGADKSIINISEKLILQDQVDLVIGFCGKDILNQVIKIFDAYQKPFIHADLGANYLNHHIQSPYVIHHTLNLWESCYASGKYMVEHIGKKIALSASFYDGGYQLADAFVRGVMENGGEIIYNYISPLNYKEEGFVSFIDDLKDHQPDAIFGIFSYHEASTLLTELDQHHILNNIPFFTTPIMVDETSLAKVDHFSKINSISSWVFDSKNKAMGNFMNSYTHLYQKSATIFSLLGYEIGQVINQLPNLNLANDSLKDIETPRGLVRFNKRNEATIDHFLVNELHNQNYKTHLDVVKKLVNDVSIELSPSEYEQISSSGWKNPYICT